MNATDTTGATDSAPEVVDTDVFWIDGDEAAKNLVALALSLGATPEEIQEAINGNCNDIHG